MKAHAGLPEAFLNRLKDIVPVDAFEAVLASLADPDAVAFRINPLRGVPDEVLAAIEDAGIPHRPAPGFFPLTRLVPADQREALVHGPWVGEGTIYLQNLSSMLAPLVLSPEPNEEVLDLCAAPGSKTTQLAVLMRNRGRIAAVEAVRPRFHRLRANLERQGVTNVATYLADGRGIGRRTPERFDRVLLDAPCSSEARIRRGRPESWATWSERKIREQAGKQVRLLFSAIEALRPGGRLLYSTCTFAPEENEAVIHKALERHGDAIEVLPVQLPFANARQGLTQWRGSRFDERLRHAVRILPDGVMEGFFLCLLEKRDSIREERRRRPGPERRRRR
ncbi:MAG TPA: RsmB/NOP family class I SAM-dependent RNA methyltransferase [Thiotrichales bacterium]|nr:RsmB/NOP family class I SAM-dependent RNA methyltransferase [Thiotrichales bacterium]